MKAEIKDTDTRKGNLFIGYDNKVFSWHLGHFSVLANGVDVDEIIREPIPLTEQWLLDFGFSKTSGYPYKMLNGYIRIRNGIYFFKFYTLEVELPYVHTLQNLYHSLTNKELK